ncbi:MAG: alpha-lytic protease prodomain-containing protein [Micromonosporaceae bacterium]|nr:alpha-lytic protease prodomain-containing protein [Micromonosporaceae bacterium]
MRVRRAVQGGVIAAAILALGLATTSPVHAEQATSGPRADQASLLAAMQRDLGLSPAEVKRLIAKQAGVAQLDSRLSTALGEDYAGSWFDAKAGTLVVAVSAADRAGTVTAAGAEARVVGRSMRTLEAIKAELDSTTTAERRVTTTPVQADPALREQLANAVSWGVDAQSNQVVINVRQGYRADLAATLAQYGDAVRIEETDAVATQASDYLDGGDPYNGCSVGFNVTYSGSGHFLTAGHCGNVGDVAVQGGVRIGPFVESWYPEYDDALVRNDNTGYWEQGPWVFAYTGDPNAVYNINGSKDSPIGTAVCKSGTTTQVTCGYVRARDVTVNYDNGDVVKGLVQHSACAEPGDSGGSSYSSSGGSNYAEGVTSGYTHRTGDNRCLEKIAGAGESISYYYPIAASIAYYGFSLMTA